MLLNLDLFTSSKKKADYFKVEIRNKINDMLGSVILFRLIVYDN